MLEILVLIGLSKRIMAIAKSKGRSSAGWVVLLIVLWFAGEFTGGVIAAIATYPQEPLLEAYLFALVGAVVGAVVTFAIVKNLPSLRPQDPYWDQTEGDYREKFDLKRYPPDADPESIQSKSDTEALRPTSEEHTENDPQGKN
jgi:uncharacterized membrane protein YeaQ/YmgE (transglycosylase-associated protein family)